LVGESLKDVCDGKQFIILLDVCTSHTHPLVFEAAAAYNIWICMIPPRLTWLIQPCDTHVFASYKRLFRRLFNIELEKVRHSDVPTRVVVLVAQRVIREVINSRSWAHAFRENGFSDEPNALSNFIRLHLNGPCNPCRSNLQPELHALKDLFNLNYTGRYNIAWDPVPHPPLLTATSVPTLAESAMALLPRRRLPRKTSLADVVAANVDTPAASEDP